MISDNHFDLAAGEWDKNLLIVQRAEAIAKEIRKKIQPDSAYAALDFGSGTGLLSILLIDLFSHITLMDSSEEMTKVAKGKLRLSKIKHIHPVLFDLEKQDYTGKTFDVIYTQMALHHIADIEKILNKFFKILNPGGKLLLIDLYKEDGSFHDNGLLVHKGFDPVDLVEIIRQKGFVNISHEKCYDITKTYENGKTKIFPLFLISAEKHLHHTTIKQL